MNNKIIVLVIACMLSCLQAATQTLSQMRCYFDGNINSAEYFSLGSVSDLDAPFVVDVSALSNGMHRLYLEVMDNSGRWSLYDSDLIQVGGGLQMAQLNAVEYFFDNDPGLGEAIQIAVSGTDIDDDFVLSVDGLSNGMHRLYVRVRDGANQWSLYASKLIEVNGSIYDELVQMEYFFDIDPGLGNANQIAISGLNYDDDIELSLAGIEPGHHKLYVRVMDAVGQWSLYAAHNVEITGGPDFLNLVHGEYFFDNDPGMGNGLPIVFPVGPNVDADFELPVPADLPQTNHIVYVRVMDSAGQWSLYATQQIQVCSIQAPVITQTGGGCVGSIATLSVNNGFNSYTWSNDAISQSILVSQPGTYSVTVTDADCSATVSIDVAFDPLPTPEIIQSGIACNGNTVTLNAGSGFLSYDWNTNADTPTIQVTQNGLYSVTVSNGSCTGTDFINVNFGDMQEPTIEIIGDPCLDNVLTLDAGAGYSIYSWSNSLSTQTIQVTQSGVYGVTVADGVCSSSAQVFVEFGDIVPPVITQSGGNCQGDIITLNAGFGYDSYEWSNLLGSSSISVTQDGTYSVVVTNGNCSASDVITVDFIELPEPLITLQGDACVDPFLTLNAGAGYDQYAWSNDANTQTTQVTQSGTYSVVVSNGVCSTTSSIVVEFGQPVEPTIELTGGFCYGEIFTLDAGAGYTTYLWSNGMQTQVIEVATEGDYDVTVSNGSCSASASISVSWAVVLPQPQITQTGNTLVSGIDTLLYMVQWYFNGNPIPNATASTYEATQSGTYTVTIHDGICTRFSLDYVFVYNEVSELENRIVNIYPNPANEQVWVKWNSEGSVDWTLYDELGKVVFHKKNCNSSFVMDVSQLSAGTYTFLLQSDHSVHHEKLIVTH